MRQSLTMIIIDAVCPACSNMLTIVKVPPPEPDEDPDPDEGTHRFECRTCPYQLVFGKGLHAARADLCS